MPTRTLALMAAALSATVALAAGVIGGAFANRGTSASTASARPGPTGPPRPPPGPPGPHGRHGFFGRPNIDRDVIAVADDVRKAIAAKAPDLARPVIDKAV